MRIAVLGAGPAGLVFATLWKRRHPGDELIVVEQNAADATFGFGVVFSDRALDFLREDDPETHGLIAPRMQTWSDITLVHRGQSIAIDGIGFSAIGRLELLRLLQQRAREVGVEPVYGRVVQSLDEFGPVDLIVGADGVNSLARRSRAAEFGATLTHLDNHFAWYGVAKRFETLTQSFVETDLGVFNAHHYRYQPDMSTFIVECDPQTFTRAGFADMDEDQSRALCERVFAEALDGQPLISNRSVWRHFPRLRTQRWHAGNIALVGDALHTAHFSIGSGTRLALEDVIALVNALEAEPGDVQAGLAAYEARRRPIVEKILRAADASADWYEQFREHMRLEPFDLAMSYVTRSGRVDKDRLAAVAPRVVAAYDAAVAA